MYKNDVYLAEYGASALAADTIIRYLFSAATPLFTVQMVDTLGFHWAMSLLAFITILLAPVPWLTLRWGPALRAKSRYIKMGTEDIKKQTVRAEKGMREPKNRTTESQAETGPNTVGMV